MKQILRRSMLLLLSGLSVLATEAAVSFSARVPRHVNEGNKFNVTFVLENAQGSDFQPPADPEGTTRLYGPSISKSTSISIINGQRTDASSVEYTMIYKANRSGRITIGAASVVVNGHKMTTKPVTIEIHPGNGQQGGGPQYQQPHRTPPPVQYDDPMTQSAERAVSGNDIFVRIEMSRPRVYEQQAVVCTIKLYTKYQVSEFMPTLQPSFDGFLIEDINMQPSLNNVETYNGQRYMVALLKKCILYPQQSGKLTITSGNYDVGVVQYEQYHTPFGVMQQPVEKKLQVKSNTATVNILPLPEPRPASFTGAVGKFSVSTDLKPQQLKTYSAATLTCTLSGTGNIKYIKAPEIDFPDQFDAYEPKTDIKVNPGGADMSGRLDIEYVFVPQFVGEFDIPDTPFTYFDPDAQQYRTIIIPGRHVAVAKGEGAPSAESRQRNMDIRHIATASTQLSHNHPDVIGHWSYWLAYLLPSLLVIALLVAYRKRLSLMADRSRWLSLRAGKVASKRLKKAARLAGTDNSEAFYNELLSALWGYLSDKLSIPVSELNRDNIVAELQNYGVDQPLQQRVVALLDECEFAQYASALATGNKEEHLDRARQLINDLQRVGKKRDTISNAMQATLLLVTLATGLTAGATATPSDSLWSKANKAYTHEAYNEAIHDYRLIEQQYGSSSNLYYNMANTYYRLKDTGRAILYYERSLRLDPSNADARYNLRFVRDRAQIDENDGLSFFTRQIDNVVNRYTSNAWAWTAVVAFVFMLVALLVYLLGEHPSWRKAGFFTALAMLGLTMIAVGCAWHIHSRNVNHSQAIVVAEGAQLSSVPRDPKDKSEVVDHLPVGSKVSVLDSVANENILWLDVRTVDRQRAWIKRSSVEPI